MVTRTRWNLIIGGVIAAVLVGGLAAPASATEPADVDSNVGTQEAVLSDEQVAELEVLYGATDVTSRAFDVDLAVAAGASPQGAADYAAVLAAEGWDVRGETIDASTGAREVAGIAAACTGRSGYTGYYGAFWQVALNSCQTETLILAIRGVGGGTAAIGGLLAAIGFPGGAIVTAVGILIVANPWPLDVCKAASGQSAIYINIFVVGGVGCWGQ